MSDWTSVSGIIGGTIVILAFIKYLHSRNCRLRGPYGILLSVTVPYTSKDFKTSRDFGSTATSTNSSMREDSPRAFKDMFLKSSGILALASQTSLTSQPDTPQSESPQAYPRTPNVSTRTPNVSTRTPNVSNRSCNTPSTTKRETIKTLEICEGLKDEKNEKNTLPFKDDDIDITI